MNTRKKSGGGRRMSKTFRQYPQIVIHPPEETLTSSLPDINASCQNEKKMAVATVMNNVSDKNVSCPDLSDKCLFEEAANPIFVFTAANLRKAKSKPAAARGRTTLTRRNSDGVQLRRKPSMTLLASRRKRKKKDESPSDILKKSWKIKHSASMHNLKSHVTGIDDANTSFDTTYHTVHGGFGGTNARLRMFSFEDSFNSRTNSKEGVYSKCCCGRRLCEAVVPIQKYLETYFVNQTKETFEEMLNRQKAELNALMEAHRKQQLEFMEFHRRQIEENKKM